MYLPSLLVIPLVAVVEAYTFTLDCGRYPGPCNNDCYAIYVAGKPQSLNWFQGGGTYSSDQRRAAGCTPTPCPCPRTPNRVPPMNAPPGATSCDEYPYASAVEGGTGAILRCTIVGENTGEGSALGGFLSSTEGCGGEACTYSLAFINAGAGSPFCVSQGGVNDGFEYTFNGQYILARDGEPQEPKWELHQPDPAHYFPPQRRREFLLENGERATILSTDLDSSFDDEIFVFENNGTYEKAGVVRELHGMEKSPAFRPTLRDRSAVMIDSTFMVGS